LRNDGRPNSWEGDGALDLERRRADDAGKATSAEVAMKYILGRVTVLMLGTGDDIGVRVFIEVRIVLKADFMSIILEGPLSRLAQQNKNPVLLCVDS